METKGHSADQSTSSPASGGMCTATTRIGLRVTGAPSYSELFYFDEIAILYSRAHSVFGYRMSPEERACIDYLTEKGVVVDVGVSLDQPGTSSIVKAASQMVSGTYRGMTSILDKIIDEIERAEPGDNPAPPEEVAQFWDKLDRACLGVLEQSERTLALPYRLGFQTLPQYEPTTVISGYCSYTHQASDTRALDIVLRKFPIPAKDSPLEAILDFRADAEAMMARRRLQRWVSKCAKESLTPREMEDEFQELIDQYTEYMRLHRLKHRHGLLRIVVSTVADCAESLLRLRPSAAMNALFAFRASSIALTEAELQAPGRQVAYVVRAQDNFG